MTITFGELVAFVSVFLVVLGLVVKVIANNGNQRKQLYARLDAERLKAGRHIHQSRYMQKTTPIH